MHLYPMTGAAARVGNADTAFSYRDPEHSPTTPSTRTFAVSM